MNRAIVRKVFPGDFESEAEYPLELVCGEKPSKVAPGHVLVRLTMRPINPIDLRSISTGELEKLKEKGAILGSEGVGVIEAAGENVKTFDIGQRVVPVLYWDYLRSKGYGAWQEYVKVAEGDLLRVPDSVPDEVAAQYIINPWTAHGLLVDSGVPKGGFLLMSAAGSPLGRQIIQMAKHKGIKVIGIVRREEQKKELIAIGAEHVINSTSEDVLTAISKVTGGEGAYAGLDAVGGVMTKVMAASLRRGGKVFIYAKLGGSDYTMSLADLKRNVQVQWWALTDYLQIPGNKEKTTRETMEFLEKRILVPISGKKYDLSSFREAIAQAETNSKDGRILLCS